MEPKIKSEKLPFNLYNGRVKFLLGDFLSILGKLIINNKHLEKVIFNSYNRHQGKPQLVGHSGAEVFITGPVTKTNNNIIGFLFLH